LIDVIFVVSIEVILTVLIDEFERISKLKGALNAPLLDVIYSLLSKELSVVSRESHSHLVLRCLLMLLVWQVSGETASSENRTSP
jgi:hypothetical protein